MPKTILFFYGTLKRGGRNVAQLAGQEFLAEVRTLPRYRLYDNVSHPCLVEDGENGVAVPGEIWRVDEPTLARLDEFEEGEHLFARREIALDGPAPVAMAYFYLADISRLADCGDHWPTTP